MSDRTTGGPYNGQHRWVVVLVGETRVGTKQPRAYSYTVVRAATGADAIAAGYPEGTPILSTKRVVGAVAYRLDPDAAQTTANLEVSRPKWGHPRTSGLSPRGTT